MDDILKTNVRKSFERGAICGLEKEGLVVREGKWVNDLRALIFDAQTVAMLIYGEKNMGKTTLIQQIVDGESKCIYVQLEEGLDGVISAFNAFPKETLLKRPPPETEEAQLIYAMRQLREQLSNWQDENYQKYFNPHPPTLILDVRGRVKDDNVFIMRCLEPLKSSLDRNLLRLVIVAATGEDQRAVKAVLGERIHTHCEVTQDFTKDESRKFYAIRGNTEVTEDVKLFFFFFLIIRCVLFFSETRGD